MVHRTTSHPAAPDRPAIGRTVLHRPASRWLADLLVATFVVVACSRGAEPANDLEADSNADAQASPALGPRARSLQDRSLPASPRRKGVKADASSAAAPGSSPGSEPAHTPGWLGSSAGHFRRYGVNPTIDTEEYPVSSFALDVDTAAYSLARAFLARDELPDSATIRIEEFINAFDYGYGAPEQGDLRIDAEVVPSPTRAAYHVLRVGIRAREVADADRAPANLAFVVDVSASMAREGRLQLVQDALRALVQRLGTSDVISIIAYGNVAQVVLAPTPGSDADAIEAAIARLQPGGSTDVDAGLRLGYELVGKTMLPWGTNRVVLCSDGVATSGPTSAEALLKDVATRATMGVSISTIGVGVEDYDDVLLEQLAERGKGDYAYVDRPAEAKRTVLRNLTGALQVVARDARVQVEFNPAQVARYRLLGYENRDLASDSVTHERTDVGEIAAGHMVTALYEVQFRGSPTEEFATIRLRFRPPRGGTMDELIQALGPANLRPSLADASPGTVLALTVATFAEKLRESYWAAGTTWQQVAELFDRLPPEWQHRRDVVELGALLAAARRVDKRSPARRDMAWSQTEFDRLPILKSR